MSAARADAVEQRVAERGLDLLLVGDLVRPGGSSPDSMASLRWLTGFKGSSGLAIVGPGLRTFLTDFRYEGRAADEVDSSFDVVIVDQRLLADAASRLRGRVGFDETATSVESFRKLESEVAGRAELVASAGVVEDLRRSKDAQELAAVGAATELADAAFTQVLEGGLVGRSEREVAAAIEDAIRAGGGEPAFRPVIGAGPNGALPHAEPGERRIEAGELVVCDWGARLDGYCSDCTRTVATGEVGEEEREVYELVRRAQERALDATAVGVGGAEADAVARSQIADAGHGERFGHGLGHGVGLEIHEAPRLGRGSEDVLREGDVVTVEPGVYLPGRFGVRIEDLVVVTAEGLRILTSHPKDLLVVGDG